MMPGSGPSRKSVHSGSKNHPSASSGTPRTTFPSAAPKKIARNPLDREKTASQSGRQVGLSM